MKIDVVRMSVRRRVGDGETKNVADPGSDNRPRRAGDDRVTTLGDLESPRLAARVPMTPNVMSVPSV